MSKSMVWIYSFLLLTLLNCAPYVDGHKAISYGTSEFEEFQRKAKIKKEQAFDIQHNLAIKKSEVYIHHYLTFVIDGEYVFTSSFNINKKTTSLSYSVIHVNAESGKAYYTKRKRDVYLKYKGIYSKDGNGFE